MEPSIGRIVNYHCLEGERFLGPGDDMILPAIITRVYHESPVKAVNLIVFTNQPSAPLTMRMSVAMGMTNGGGWTWPMLVAADHEMEQRLEKEPVKVEPAKVKVATLPKLG